MFEATLKLLDDDFTRMRVKIQASTLSVSERVLSAYLQTIYGSKRVLLKYIGKLTYGLYIDDIPIGTIEIQLCD